MAAKGTKRIRQENRFKVEYRYNDGGQAAAGFAGRSGGCVTRALAIHTGTDWMKVARLISQRRAQYGGPGNPFGGIAGGIWMPIAKQLGLKETRIAGLTLEQIRDEFGDCIIRSKGNFPHLAALKGNAIHDNAWTNKKLVPVSVWQ